MFFFLLDLNFIIFCPLEQFEPILLNFTKYPIKYLEYLVPGVAFSCYYCNNLVYYGFNTLIISGSFSHLWDYFSALNYSGDFYVNFLASTRIPARCASGVFVSEFFLILFPVLLLYFFAFACFSFFPLRFNLLQLIFFNVYKFMYGLFVENCSKKLYYFYILIFILFLNLCLFNSLGMLPYTFTVTSHIIFTLNYSFLFFVGLNILGVFLYGFYFLGLFLPSGSPLVIAPFLILIEFISYIARLFSLAIRLFANLMSGHTLLNILAGFSWSMLLNSGVFILGSFCVLSVIFLIVGLELAIAFLQGYVFCILLIIYFNDALSALDH